jgi:hypothetical protein
MAAKLKVDQLESVDGSTNITLNNSITMAATKTLPAASLTGTLPAISGASLTSLTAGNLTGTIADARFPATLPAASAANLTAVPAANITGALPAISGASLTGLTSSQMPAGTILQVKDAYITGQVSFTGTTVYSGLQVAITPTSTNSKLWFQVNADLSSSGSGRKQIYVKYGTTGGDNSGTKAGGQSQIAQSHAVDTSNLGHTTISGILSPASTTQQYVKLILHNHDTGTGYLNYYSDTNSTQLTVMEIAG